MRQRAAGGGLRAEGEEIAGGEGKKCVLGEKKKEIKYNSLFYFYFLKILLNYPV